MGQIEEVLLMLLLLWQLLLPHLSSERWEMEGIESLPLCSSLGRWEMEETGLLLLLLLRQLLLPRSSLLRWKRWSCCCCCIWAWEMWEMGEVLLMLLLLSQLLPCVWAWGDGRWKRQSCWCCYCCGSCCHHVWAWGDGAVAAVASVIAAAFELKRDSCVYLYSLPLYPVTLSPLCYPPPSP